MLHHTIHAADRALERFGLTPTEDEWARAVLDIAAAACGDPGPALLLARTRQTERWVVRLSGVVVSVVYDPGSARIITVLPDFTRR